MPQPQYKSTKQGQLADYKSDRRGAALIELIVALGVFVLTVSVVAFLIIDALASNERGRERAQAVFLVSEGLEAARSIRDNNWNDLTLGEHGLVVSSSRWVFAGTTEDVSSTLKDGARQVIVENIDANRRRVISQVNWRTSEVPARAASATLYLSNWRALSIGNWAAPSLDGYLDLTVANSGNSSADVISATFANNYVYLGRNNGSGREFYVVDVSNTALPIIAGQRDLNGNPNDIVINGNYAYIASTDNSSELQIVDISDPSTINQPGKLTVVDLTVANSGNANANAQALATDGQYLYMARNGGDEFLIFDLSNPASPGAPIGRSSAPVGTFYDMDASGNYAYLASNDNSSELQIMNTANKNAPILVVSFNLNSGNNNADARTLDCVSDYLFVGRSGSAAPELYSINVSNPLAPLLASTLEIGADIKHLTANGDTGYVFMATADTSNDFQVVDASNPSSLPPPPALGRLDLTNAPNQIVYDAVLDRTFLGSSADIQELQVVRPQ